MDIERVCISKSFTFVFTVCSIFYVGRGVSCYIRSVGLRIEWFPQQCDWESEASKQVSTEDLVQQNVRCERKTKLAKLLAILLGTYPVLLPLTSHNTSQSLPSSETG
jgi:hypothetical protein